MTEVLKMSKFQGKCLLLLIFPAFVTLEDNGWETKTYSAEMEKKIKRDIGPVVETDSDTSTLSHQGTYRRQIPEHFDVRKQWGYCADIIGYIRDQGECASCWANGGAAVISDRICIGSKGNIKKLISVEDLVSCCVDTRNYYRPCRQRSVRCHGGSAKKAFEMWISEGIVTGGNHNETDPDKIGCLRYAQSTYEGEPPECMQRCSNHRLEYEEDKQYGRVQYQIRGGEQAMQTEIMNHGSIATWMKIYEDYRRYGSGIYQYTKGPYEAQHIVKIIGWGVKKGRKYWLIANSYGDEWGESGYFRMRRGQNEVGIETFSIAGRLNPLNRAREWIVDNGPQSFGNLNKSSLLNCLYLFLFLLCLN